MRSDFPSPRPPQALYACTLAPISAFLPYYSKLISKLYLSLQPSSASGTAPCCAHLSQKHVLCLQAHAGSQPALIPQGPRPPRGVLQHEALPSAFRSGKLGPGSLLSKLSASGAGANGASPTAPPAPTPGRTRSTSPPFVFVQMRLNSRSQLRDRSNNT